MRFSPVALALSVALLTEGQAAFRAGELEKANDTLETALAIDPRNRAAFVALGKVAQAQQLPGKAIRMYFEALSLEPNDVTALSAQGEAMVQKGAIERARVNLARVKTLCKAECAPATQLAAAIAKGPPPAVIAAQNNSKVPPKGEEKSSADQ